MKGSKLFVVNQIIFLSLIFWASFFIISSSKKNKIIESKFDPCKGFSFECKKGKQIVVIYSSMGEIEFELYPDYAPLTVANFLDLVNKGIYNNTSFHRVIKEPYPFIIQGGEPNPKRIRLKNPERGLGVFIDSKNGKPRLIPLEIKIKKEGKPRYNKIVKNPNEINKIFLKHERGTISMARSEPLNSASSQFYISLKKLPVLDGRYAVFGKIIKGFDVLNTLNKGDKINKIVHIKK